MLSRDARDGSGSGDTCDELLARWREHGDRGALDALIASEIEGLKTRIRSRAGHMTGPSASASDVAQAAALRLLEREDIPEFANALALRAYLWTTAWRLLLDKLRSAGKSVTELDASNHGDRQDHLATTGGLGEVEQEDMSIALGLSINLLEPEDQEILTLVHFRKQGIDGAACELRISRSAANMRLSRARRSLARKLLHWTELIG